MRKIWDIPGGIHPPENKSQSLAEPLAEAALPEQVILPLSMHMGQAAEPIVKVGDNVLTGQMVAQPVGPVSAAVHASISGRIVAIEDRPIPHPSGLQALCIVIESDGEDSHISYEPVEDYRQLDPENIVLRLQNAGLAGLGGAGFPTAAKLIPLRPINTLILNGTECEPYITSDHTLMREKAAEIVKGMELLAYVLGEPETLLIGVEDNKPDAIETLEKAAAGTRIEIVSFPTKYPSGGEKQLIQILTGLEVPSGGLPANQGIVMQNVGTAVAAWEAIVLGKPLISRITTLVGEALEQQCNRVVRIGTPVADLLAQVGYSEKSTDRVVMGGPMMGFAMHDTKAPVTKITNCLLVPTKQELPELPPAQPCIRCGQCAEACPASLLPQQLFWYAESHDHEKLKDYNLFDCIECGACAYVCPSSIPLVQYYRAAKGEIRQEEIERKQSDHARERFEARKLRLEKEAEEREVKRQARMAAAKEKQAKSPDQDIVAKAMARVASTKESSADDRAKLERQRQTLVERIEGMQKKAEDAETEEQTAKFLAQIKNSEKRLAGVDDRLRELDEGTTPDETKAPTQNSETPIAIDAASAAIAKAQARADAMGSLSERDKLAASVDSLQARLAKSEAKLLAEAAKAGSETNDIIEALRAGRDKLSVKLQGAQAELAELDRTHDTSSN